MQHLENMNIWYQICGLLFLALTSQASHRITPWVFYWPQVQYSDYMIPEYSEIYEVVPPPNMLRAAFIGHVRGLKIVDCPKPQSNFKRVTRIAFAVDRPIVGEVSSDIDLLTYSVFDEQTGRLQHECGTAIAPFYQYLAIGDTVLVCAIPKRQKRSGEELCGLDADVAGYVRYLVGPMDDLAQRPLQTNHSCEPPVVVQNASGGFELQLKHTKDPDSLGTLIDLIRRVHDNPESLKPFRPEDGQQ